LIAYIKMSGTVLYSSSLVSANPLQVSSPNNFVDFYNNALTAVTANSTGSYQVAPGVFQSGAKMTQTAEGRWLFPRPGRYKITGYNRCISSASGSFGSSAYYQLQLQAGPSTSISFAGYSHTQNVSTCNVQTAFDTFIDFTLIVTDATIPYTLSVINQTGFNLSTYTNVKIISTPF